MTQRRDIDPFYVRTDPMRGAARGPAAAILGAAFATFGPGGGAILFGGVAIFGGNLFASFLVRAALGLLLNALTPKPRVPSRGYQVTASGSALDHQIIYGETRAAGVRVFDGTSGSSNRFLHRVIVFAGHEVEGFTEVYLNDYKLTVNLATGAVTSAQNSAETTNRYNNRVRIIARLGTDDQTAIPEMLAEVPGWTSAHRLRGLAYLYIRLQFDAEVFPNGVPEITATVRGKKVFDPRTETSAWSDNPALCIRDYLTSSAYGLGATGGEIDDVLVAQAANVCDESVEGEKRFTLNGAFTTGAARADIVQGLLTSMGGMLWHAQGRWRMKPAYYTAPVLALTSDDLRSGLQIQTRNARRDNFNTVRGTFRGPETEWQVTDYKPVSDPAFVFADNGVETAVDLDLPFTTSHLTAQRIARIALQQQREQVTVSGRFGMRAFQVQVGDTVTLTNPRLGWTDKEFEVISWTFGFSEDFVLDVQMTLRETSAAVFVPTPGAVFESNNTLLPSPFFVPGVGITATSVLQILNEKVTITILVNVASATPEFIDAVEVQFRETGTDEWITVGTGPLGRFEILDVQPAQYDIRARAINTLGIKGVFEVLAALDVTGKTTPPSDVFGLFADVNGGAVTLDWSPIPDLDLSHYIVRHAVETTGASWADATTSAIKVPRPASEITLPVKPGTYMLRAVDKSDNQSVNFTSVVVPLGALETFANTLTIDENGSFPGTFDGTELAPTSGPLAQENGSEILLEDGNTLLWENDSLLPSVVISATSSAPSEGSYMLDGYLDTGAPRRFRSRVDVATRRQADNIGLWDDIPGDFFDQIPGTFDNWTGNVQFADTDVQTFISLTQDDPAGTPTWTDFQQFKAGDFFARAARFMVVLRSTSPDVTPRVTRLTALVEYD
jgi:hypothetical protein